MDLKKILDFGCGCGRVTRWAADSLPNSQIFAVDIDPDVINWCKKELINI
jgi:spermidine synthase